MKIPEEVLEEPAKKMEEINKIYGRFLAGTAERKISLAPDILQDIEKKVS